LTRLLAVRYFNACNFDRAAQSKFGVVVCCTGVFSGYRASVVKSLLKEYIEQTWMGKPCTFGDDRHLTSMFLKLGYKVVYQKTAIAHTYAPTSLKTWLKQQLRWNRSFWRENILMSKWMFKRSKVLSTFILIDSLLPFIYICFGLIPFFMLISSFGWIVIPPYIFAISIMAYIRNSKYWRRVNYYLIPMYAFLYSLLLLPIYIYALFTTDKTSWLTR